MNYRLPYILTFLSYASFSYLLAAYSYVHKELTQTYQISKTQFGIIYSVSALGSSIGTIIYIAYTARITLKIINYYTMGNIGFTLPYLAIALVSTFYQHPHKIVLYILLFLIGFFRTFIFASIIIMIKIHKEIVHKKQSISQTNYKLLLTVWSVSFDIGIILGFFISNWTDVSLGLNWKWILIIGVMFSFISNILLYLILKEYMQKQYFQTVLSVENNDQKEEEGALQSDKKMITYPTFLKLIWSYCPSVFFLINATVLDIMHTCLGMILPPYFHSIGYRGKQGYILAILSCFIIVGTWLFSVSDYFVNKLVSYFSQENQPINQNEKIQNKKIKSDQMKEGQVVFHFNSSISLFFFVAIVLLIAIDSLNTNNTGPLEQPNYKVQMIYMCLMGLFFGGPAQGYFSYHIIRIMEELQKRHQYNLNSLKMDNNLKITKKYLQQGSSCFERLSYLWKTHKFGISSSLITLNCLLFQLGTIPFFIVCFYIIETHTSLLFFFLSCLGFTIFISDLIQNIMVYRSMKANNKQKSKQNSLYD